MSEHGRFSRRDVLKIGAVAGAGAAIRLETPTLFQGASASVQVPQTALPGASITRFAEPVPTYFGKRVSGPALQVSMYEFQQKVLPDAFYATVPDGFKKGTYVWGYACGQLNGPAAPQWPGATLEVRRGYPATVKYVNDLPFNSTLRRYLTVDQTIHWANPLDASMSPGTSSGSRRRPPRSTASARGRTCTPSTRPRARRTSCTATSSTTRTTR
jgi:spore coat protein A